MIVEESYRTEIGKSKIEGLMITNGMEVAKHKTFMSMIKTFDLFKDRKLWADGRYQIAFMLSQYVDIVVSHQILNPLNYLYLDAAFIGYPVLHNAPMCKDIGYYYSDFNYDEAEVDTMLEDINKFVEMEVDGMV
jgi:hypothetical protein